MNLKEQKLEEIKQKDDEIDILKSELKVVKEQMDANSTGECHKSGN